jgi:hypothetical protein
MLEKKKMAESKTDQKMSIKTLTGKHALAQIFWA